MLVITIVERLLRRVKPPKTAGEAIMRILLAVDGSQASQDAVDELARRPWPPQSAVRIISVIRPYVPAPAEFVPGAVTVDDVLEQHEKEAAEMVAGAAERVAREGLTVESATLRGDPRTVIVDEAEHWGAELIVVGYHGRTGLKRLLLGSVAHAVVAHAPCSVEVVRRRDIGKHAAAGA